MPTWWPHPHECSANILLCPDRVLEMLRIRSIKAQKAKQVRTNHLLLLQPSLRPGAQKGKQLGELTE